MPLSEASFDNFDANTTLGEVCSLTECYGDIFARGSEPYHDKSVATVWHNGEITHLEYYPEKSISSEVVEIMAYGPTSMSSLSNSSSTRTGSLSPTPSCGKTAHPSGHILDYKPPVSPLFEQRCTSAETATTKNRWIYPDFSASGYLFHYGRYPLALGEQKQINNASIVRSSKNVIFFFLPSPFGILACYMGELRCKPNAMQARM